MSQHVRLNAGDFGGLEAPTAATLVPHLDTKKRRARVRTGFVSFLLQVAALSHLVQKRAPGFRSLLHLVQELIWRWLLVQRPLPSSERFL